MIKDIMTVIDKCQKCGKEFELGDCGNKTKDGYVCIACSLVKKSKLAPKPILKPEPVTVVKKPVKRTSKKSI